MNDYFSFSKRERTGGIVLVLLISFVFLLPEFISSKKNPDARSIAEMQKELEELKMTDSVSGKTGSQGDIKEDDPILFEPSDDHADHKKLTYFDPNTVSEDEWKKLGISERTAKTIRKYISKGGQFRKPEDLGKIYGLPKNLYGRLLPFVRIKSNYRDEPEDGYEQRSQQMANKSHDRSQAIIDMNEADTSVLIELPGIGSKLANRIIHFRDRLGGFYSVNQLKEIYGMPDSTFQNIKSFLRCDSSHVQLINVNTVDASILKNHPYIKWNIANAIVNYRQQHGQYTSVEDLLKIEIITADILQKVTPYIRVK